MRSLLIVPPGDGAAYATALASGADAMVVDAADVSAGVGPALFLRLPPLDAPGAGADLRAALALRPRGVVLHGATGGADAQRLGARLAVEEARLGLPEGAIRVLAFATDSAAAVLGLASFRGASQRLEALVWSAAPLDAALNGAPGRRIGGPIQLARALTLYAARAAGVLALDAPCADADLDAEAREAALDGFDGKAALSAAQVAVIHQAFPRRG